MKRIIAVLIILFALPAYSAEPREEHSLNVNGIGEVEVAVDNVMISAGINTRDKSLAAAKEANQNKYHSLLKVLEKNGLAKTAIKANSTYINPVYVTCYPTPQNPEPKCDTSKVNYYEINRSIEIKLEDLTKYDALIAGLSEAATNVNTGQYSVTAISKYRDQARELAIDSAKSKAEKVAKKLAVPLGKPIRFESYDGDANVPMPMMAQRAGKANMMAMGESAPATDTQTLGKIKVVVNVNIAYSIE